MRYFSSEQNHFSNFNVSSKYESVTFLLFVDVSSDTLFYSKPDTDQFILVDLDVVTPKQGHLARLIRLAGVYITL